MITRRTFLENTAVGLGLAATSAATSTSAASGTATGAGPIDTRRRAEGLLLGSLIGDALGGPIEFQSREAAWALPNGTKEWRAGERLDDAAVEAARRRWRLRGYSPLRPIPEPYGHWESDAAPGTVTDDSRHKMILMAAVRRARERGDDLLRERDFAQAYLDWPTRPFAKGAAAYDAINDEWLREMRYAARWVLGERDVAKALPPARLWVGLTTCCGQMALPPLACAFAGKPNEAYLAAHDVAFIDNGWGRDLNACLVAGLAAALATPTPGDNPGAAWESLAQTMSATDPYRYRDVPWTERAIDRWSRAAREHVAAADGCPAALIASLDAEFAETTKWEAHVCVVAMLAFAELGQYDPLASMQLCLEWGHDTDSYAQLLGAFYGALYGPDVFPAAARKAVATRLEADYGERIDEWVSLLCDAPLIVMP
ncbi:MAG: ADP-ribosylglycohydrolase family protein [Lacipirellulaceae bacterium]